MFTKHESGDEELKRGGKEKPYTRLPLIGTNNMEANRRYVSWFLTSL